MHGWKVAVLVAGLVAVTIQPVVSRAPQVDSATAVVLVAAAAGPGDAAAAAGGGLRAWWGVHGKTIAEVAGCFLDGAALGRCIAVGVVASGGVLAVAALVVAGAACLA